MVTIYYNMCIFSLKRKAAEVQMKTKALSMLGEEAVRIIIIIIISIVIIQ